MGRRMSSTTFLTLHEGYGIQCMGLSVNLNHLKTSKQPRGDILKNPKYVKDSTLGYTYGLILDGIHQ